MGSKRSAPNSMARERSRYSDPIVSRDAILQQLKQLKKPVSAKQLWSSLKVKRQAIDRCQIRLNAMVRDKQVSLNRSGYQLAGQLVIMKGNIRFKRDGSACLKQDNTVIFYPRQLWDVMEGDQVSVCYVKSAAVPSIGMVLQVVTRKSLDIIGRYYHDLQGAYVVARGSFNRSISLSMEDSRALESGDYILMRIQSFTKPHQPVKVKLIKRLGSIDTPGIGSQIVQHQHGIRSQWSTEIDQQLIGFDDQWITQQAKKRTCLQHIPFVTIDGEQAKDFDDAIYVQRHQSGWQVYVAIADVSSFVTEDSALDQEAIQRGTSCYLPNQVIPMLPAKLSDDLCSLKPDQPRLALVLVCQLNDHGEVTSSKYKSAVIKSHARLTYQQVEPWLQQTARPPIELQWLVCDLNPLVDCLNQVASQRGELSFDRMATEFVFDQKDQLANVVRSSSLRAHRAIELLMVLANQCTAKYLKEHQLPGLYRVHQSPDAAATKELLSKLHTLANIKIAADIPPAQMMQSIFAQSADQGLKEVVELLVLRSLPQAKYDPNPLGHFGLALQDYAHFTSPIRRYPDLLVHRSIHANLTGSPLSLGHFDHLAGSCSTLERQAETAERASQQWYSCQWMARFQGEKFQGQVSGVCQAGLFVTVLPYGIDGLLRLSSLPDDYYHVDNSRFKVIGQSTGKVYKVGDQLPIKVKDVRIDEGHIDLVLSF
ncbi:ribonuclease R [Gammaproteobacteria bacterium]|nr:ribonuclease R [Gammaproteobacteria bacterium]